MLTYLISSHFNIISNIYTFSIKRSLARNIFVTQTFPQISTDTLGLHINEPTTSKQEQ